MGTQDFVIAPGLRLRIVGGRNVLKHFRAEYSPTAVPDTIEPAQAHVTFVRDVGVDSGRAGGHKTVRWRVSFSDPNASPMQASIALRGRPRSFGLSLVQGYFVEPLLSLASAHKSLVLLPSAAVAVDGGALLLIGRSGSGKSSLSARALAGGRIVLGDDQVLIDAFGGCLPFPRRMRFYSDLPHTAPRAYRSLPRGSRSALLALRLVKHLTRGYVAPSLRITPSALARVPAPKSLPLTRIVLLERSAEVEELTSTVLGSDAALAYALEVLAEQRQRLLASAGTAWSDANERAYGRERGILAEAFSGKQIEQLSIPRKWDAARAVETLATTLSTDLQ